MRVYRFMSKSEFKKYRNGEEEVLSNPLNISRYLVNNFIGDNYEYID